jgi:hypothetical protein
VPPKCLEGIQEKREMSAHQHVRNDGNELLGELPVVLLVDVLLHERKHRPADLEVEMLVIQLFDVLLDRKPVLGSGSHGFRTAGYILQDVIILLLDISLVFFPVEQFCHVLGQDLRARSCLALGA